MELSKFKSLLGISTTDDTKDPCLQFIMDDVMEIILTYCNIDTLPAGLLNTAYRMAIETYRGANIGSEDSTAVTTISEGDMSVTFDHHEYDADALIKRYAAQLNRFRKVAFV